MILGSLQNRALGAAIAVLLSCAAPLVQAQAQEDTKDQAQAPAGADDLALGETVPEGEVQVGQIYEVEKNEAWTVRCVKTDGGQDPCEMYQLLNDAQGTPIAEVVLFELPDGRPARAGATMVVPLETSLQQQLTVQVDSNPAKRYPFAFCNQVGCQARIGLTQDEVNAYRRGSAATITIVPIRAPDQQVAVTMSLSGFTASYDKVAQLNGTSG